MTTILAGVRILEVAEHTFVPAASAVLSDLGAEVIKIEHVTRGDGMRGLASSGIAVVPGNVHVLLEHSNRGKRSLGLDLTSPDGIGILYKLAARCDVFLTNKLPSVRKRLEIDVEHIRAANPDIIYVRGTGQGERGPEAARRRVYQSHRGLQGMRRYGCTGGGSRNSISPGIISPSCSRAMRSPLRVTSFSPSTYTGATGRSPVPGRLMPILACLLSPGPLTTQPITATVISSTPGYWPRQTGIWARR